VHSGPPERVELEFQPTVADYVTAREWHPSQTFASTDDGLVRMTLNVCIDRALQSWILSFGPFARVRAPESLAREIVAFTQRLRSMDLFKAPGIAETLDWAEALITLDRIALDPQTVADTLGVLLKYQDDVGALSPEVAARLVAEVQAEGIKL